MPLIMALSMSNRRQFAQSSTTCWSARQQQQLSVLPARGPHPQRLQKQHSFTETSRSSVQVSRSARPAYLSRGLSVDRSYENFRQRLIAARGGSTSREQQQQQQVRRSNSKFRDNTLKVWRNNSNNKSTLESKETQVGVKQTAAVLRTGIDELKSNGLVTGKSIADTNAKVKFVKSHSTTLGVSQSKLAFVRVDDKAENRINLNIVLAQSTKNSLDNEATNSDIDSCSEAADTFHPATAQPLLPIRVNVGSAQQRRAQFRSSRSITVNASTNSNITTTTNTSSVNPIPITSNSTALSTIEPPPLNGSGNFSASPSLIVQRRPPLVRAMSAPVRSRSLDENNKATFAVNKRKLRRRKLLPRNASVCEGADTATADNQNDLVLDLNGSRKKPPLARARSTIAVDVITLVSLVSSEGSDSEKEDSSTPTERAETSNTSRPSSLRKTGKSVSFQENYPPNFQLATKEYSHMIRRGSIAPLAARLRANRPPTAPPVSIFMNDTTNTEAMTTPSAEQSDNATSGNEERSKNNSPIDKENKIIVNRANSEAEECAFPEYVRSIKERECWKLYRKMSLKGVNVTYETILRGMLTPTEFRQIQKQRELEEAKARALEEAREAEGKQAAPLSAVERLTQGHLKKQ